MKVVLSILVLLYCAAQVQSLTCLVCPAGTADETTCTNTLVCPEGQTCFSTYTGSGSTITVEKGCKAACVDAVNPRTSCCSADKCNQVQLRCYTCDKASDETTCAVNVCGLSDDTCKNTYEKTGTGPSTAYIVTKTCATKATCTQQLDVFPRVSCCTQASCNGLLACFTCTDTTDESSCAASSCASETFCKSDYKLSSTGVPAVTKSCAADCKAVDNTADKNTRTTCCKAGYCNENALSCNTCSNQADESKCVATACPGTEKICQSSYTLTAPGGQVTKTCAAAGTCITSDTVKCCGTSQCNVDALLCYTCDKQSVEKACTDITACGPASGKCSSVYETAVDGTITVTKGCEASRGACVTGTVGNKRTACCDTDLCNVPKLSCLTCSATTDENVCTSKACDVTNAFCDSVYDISKTPPTVVKKCAAACSVKTATTETKCCSMSDCNVPKLSCLTCSATTDETVCTSKACDVTNAFCDSVYDISKTPPTVVKKCAAACSAKTATTETKCCSMSDCNDYATCTVASCCQAGQVTKTCAAAGTCIPSNTVKCCGTSQCNVDALLCYTCDKQSVETACTAITACGPASGKCSSVYETAADGTITVTKGCESSRGACVSGTVGNKRTACCDTDLCNVPKLSCLTCSATTNETVCTSKACDVTNAFCDSVYDISKTPPTVVKKCAAACSVKTATTETKCCSTSDCNDYATCTVASCCQAGQVTKTCAAAGTCIPSNTVKCCGTSQCNVDALLCYTCDKQSVETACTAITACGPASGKCSSVYETAADGKITVTKGCEESRGACVTGTVGNKRTACCDTDLCNVPKLSCLTCSATTDETVCTSKACDVTNAFCDSVYDISKTPPTVVKKCAAACSVKTATTETKCCSTSDCNGQVRKCYTCNKSKSEFDCTSLTTCGVGVTSCFSFYDTTPAGTTVTKGCDGTCANLDDLSKRRTCCTTDLCNEPKLSCYTCSGLADEKQCTTVTACSATNKFCKTIRGSIAGKTVAVIKTCEDTCTASTSVLLTVECCQTGLCNKYKERGVNGSPSTRASYLLLTLPVGLLTALLKQTL